MRIRIRPPKKTGSGSRIRIPDPVGYTLRRYVVFAFCPKYNFLLKVKLGYTGFYLGRKNYIEFIKCYTISKENFLIRIRIRQKDADPTGSGSATLLKRLA
jgi:hypothetical protein